MAVEDTIELEDEIESDEVQASVRIIKLSVPKGETHERSNQYLAGMIAQTSRRKRHTGLAANAIPVNAKLLTPGSC